MAENELLIGQPPEPPSWNSVGKGFLLWLALLVITGAVLVGFSAILSGLGIGGWTFVALFQQGFWQWLSVLPAFLMLRKRNRFETAKGLLISACGLFMLNAICSGSLLLSSRR